MKEVRVKDDMNQKGGRGRKEGRKEVKGRDGMNQKSGRGRNEGSKGEG